MDEPCASLDPLSTTTIEQLIGDLRTDLTIVVVTHNLGQARRISDAAGFVLDGEIVEHGPASELFERPREPDTREYIAGMFG
jgi:phosphate transport system ATP-binding protein